jgi:regulator of cell morphogenesis and NO signaling
MLRCCSTFEKEKAVLFQMLGRSGTPVVVHPIGVMRTEHEEYVERLQHLMALRQNPTSLTDACTP